MLFCWCISAEERGNFEQSQFYSRPLIVLPLQARLVFKTANMHVAGYLKLGLSIVIAQNAFTGSCISGQEVPRKSSPRCSPYYSYQTLKPLPYRMCSHLYRKYTPRQLFFYRQPLSMRKHAIHRFYRDMLPGDLWRLRPHQCWTLCVRSLRRCWDHIISRHNANPCFLLLGHSSYRWLRVRWRGPGSWGDAAVSAGAYYRLYLIPSALCRNAVFP